MTSAQLDHATRISREAAELIGPKYERGQKEHGGNLWEKPLGDAMTDEVTDFTIYHRTRRQQDKRIAAMCQSMIDSGQLDIPAMLEIQRLLA